ncbi:MAG: 6-phosphogluconolactonase [Propionibacteriaceae bacterium]|jgi:6-phosphogluconolactonase|nr:6-phosphogluconolactonase [Propionibacteriaceae bacterium]
MQLVRHISRADLVERAAGRLVSHLEAITAEGRIPQLCISGGQLLSDVFMQCLSITEAMGQHNRHISLWWAEDYYLPTGDSRRLATSFLAQIADKLLLDPALIHPMPASEASADASIAAENYAKELESAQFDIVLLEPGPDGSLLGIPSEVKHRAQATAAALPGENGEPDRIILTLEKLATSAEVWMLALGEDHADTLAEAFLAEPASDAATLRGTQKTVWLADMEAAKKLPYFRCSL